jgi:hypothetical protein
MSRIFYILGTAIGLASLVLVSWRYWQPGSNAANVLPERIISSGKALELGTSLHLDDPHSIVNDSAKGKAAQLDVVLAQESPSPTPTPLAIIPKTLSRLSVVRQNKGLMLQYKFSDSSEETKTAQAANPLATPPILGR